MEVQKTQNTFSSLLMPFSLVYSGIMKARRAFFKKGILPQTKQEIPTISVGNISWGGTGKTPIVEYITSWALKKKIRATVLTRGYGAKLPYAPLVVNPAHNAVEVGDEPLMIADSLPMANIVVDPVRKRAMKYVMENMTPELFILDDGFQHLHVDRHLDLVLLNYNDLQSGFNKVIPAGTWREPFSALKDADAYLIKANRHDWENLCLKFSTKISQHKKPLFAFSMQPIALIPAMGEFNMYPAEILKDSPYAFITAIGAPKQARDSLVRFMGREPAFERFYSDHYQFSIRESLELSKLNIPIICTHKDVVKLKKFKIKNLWFLKTRMCFGSSYGTDLPFPTWLETWWQKQSPRSATKDKEGLLFDELKEFNGDSAQWGEDLFEIEMPQSFLLPSGWGSVAAHKGKAKKNIFSKLLDKEIKPQQTATEEATPEVTPVKEFADKRKPSYAYTLSDNIKEVKNAEEALKKINERTNLKSNSSK